MLKQLTVVKHPRVAAGTSLSFGDGITVLLGRNGTGKTTLLRLVSMCLRSDFSPLQNEDFEVRYELALPLPVRVSVANRAIEPGADGQLMPPRGGSPRRDWELTLEVDIPSVSHHETLRIESTAKKSSVCSSLEGSSPVELNPISAFEPHCVFSAFYELGVVRLTRLAQSRKSAEVPPLVVSTLGAIKDLGSAFRFDESTAIFDAIRGHGIREYPPVQIDLNHLGEGWLGAGNLIPSDHMSRVAEHTGGAPPAELISWNEADATWLRTFRESAGMSSVEMKASLLKATEERREYGRHSFLITKSDGTVIRETDLSYGEQRLLAFLYYLECNPRVVVADELVNGLHHEWIETCIDAIGERQAFLASQNPLLLDFLRFASPDEAGRRFILCAAEDDSGHSSMHWKNMTQDQAARFFSGYQAGAQHVSQILRAEGLW